MIGRGLDWISKALLVLASMLAFALCFVVVTDVTGRVLFNKPFQGTPELVSSSIVIICYLQCAYAIRSGGMLETDAIMVHFPPRLRSVFSVVSSLLGVLLFGLVFWGSLDGLDHAIQSGEYEGEGALRVPMWPVRLTVLVGSGLAVLAYVLLALRHLGAARRGEVLVTGSWH
jgi:TRAP-type C4-dicarboxylate transport system permease small subunit